MTTEKVVKGFLEKKEFTDPQSLFLYKFQLKTPLEEIKKYYEENKSKINLNLQDDDDYYPIHQVVLLKNFSYVQFIVENLPNKEKDINNVDSIGNSALHLAVTLKNMDEIITYLIQHGADINLTNNKGQTPLHLACGKNRIENVNILVVNPKIKYNPIDEQGFTPLIKACASQAYDVVKCLLRSKDVNINLKDKSGNTALHYLCEDEKFDIAIQIIKEGGDIEDKNNDGKTPLDLIKTDDIKSIILSYLKKQKEDNE
jgi:ankyrin repeat protein